VSEGGTSEWEREREGQKDVEERKRFGGEAMVTHPLAMVASSHDPFQAVRSGQNS
jgi:hypothetical protein